MVKVDQEEHAAYLQRFSKHGGYVPRFFFLKHDGTMNPAITSGHPRYPFFFHSNNLGALKAAMKKAIAG